jgi:hypothetical protein
MNRWTSKLVAAAAAVTLSASAFAAPFTAGNLVVYRVGTGGSALTSAATAVFLDEYTPAGTLMQSISASLTASGTASSEGFLSLTADGQSLVIPGYIAAAGTAGIAATLATSVQRGVQAFGLDGIGGTPINLGTTAFSGNNIRSATGTSASVIWAAGTSGGTGASNGGLWYNNGSSTQIFGGNFRNTAVQGGRVYTTTGSGTGVIRTGTTASALPTSAEAYVGLPGFTPNPSPYAFLVLDLSPSEPGVDTLYQAQDDQGLRKYSLVGGVWTLLSTVGVDADDYRGVTG